ENTSPNTEGGAEENSESSESVETVSPEVTDYITPSPLSVDGTSPFVTVIDLTPVGDDFSAGVSTLPSVISTEVPVEPLPTELNSPESTKPEPHEVVRFDGRGELENMENTTPTGKVTDIHNSTEVSGDGRFLHTLIPIENGTSEKSRFRRFMNPS
ncbi:hypothetical protein PHET_12128, partial [Paragonimus heterotremus]